MQALQILISLPSLIFHLFTKFLFTGLTYSPNYINFIIHFVTKLADENSYKTCIDNIRLRLLELQEWNPEA